MRAQFWASSILKTNFHVETHLQTIGVACVEQNERTFSITEFEDGDFFAELEATVVLLGPKEAILPSVDGEFAKIKTVLERNNVMITVRKKNEFAIEKTDLEQDLKHLLHFEKGQKEDANAIPQMAKTLAMSALGAAIKYLDLVADTCNMGHFKIVTLNLERLVFEVIWPFSAIFIELWTIKSISGSFIWMLQQYLHWIYCRSQEPMWIRKRISGKVFWAFWIDARHLKDIDSWPSG